MPGLSPSRVLGPGGATGPGELEESSRGSEPLVLVADDEASVRELICEVLAQSGYRTLSAVQRERGLDLATRHHAESDRRRCDDAGHGRLRHGRPAAG